jgi:hypothetical protein
MEHPDIPVVIMPPVYELPIGIWRWCKMNEVCEVVHGVARLGGNDFTLTSEELVRNFAALAKTINASPEKKFFRYSVDGKSLRATEIPMDQHHPAFPPYRPFVLDIGFPYPEEMFVPEGWVLDTFKAIRRGAKAAADFGDMKLGFKPSGEPFCLERRAVVPALVKIPEVCSQ